MTRPRTALLCLLLLGTAGCPDGSPFQRYQAQLARPERREAAIDGLLTLVRGRPKDLALKTKVVFALNEAYRVDANRGQIVAVLAALADRRAEAVLVAALRDHKRSGEYLEAAVRAARGLGKLGAVEQLPALVEVLRQVRTGAQPERSSWLQRALIRALALLGDRRATPALVEVLRGDPVKHDYYLSRLAARALGRLGDPAAAKPLVASLGTTAHGLLLFEESRRALCRLGPAASPALLEAIDNASLSHGALTLLADLGQRHALARLASRAGGSDRWQVALSEATLRLSPFAQTKAAAAEDQEVDPADAAADPVGSPQQTLLALLDRPEVSITVRRRAAEVIGWHGDGDGLATRVKQQCRGHKPQQQVICWALALSLSRAASGKAAEEALDRLAKAKDEARPAAGPPSAAVTVDRADQATATAIARYRPRLSVVHACAEPGGADDASCLLGWSKKPSWRTRERAALELGRRGHSANAMDLVRLYRGAHPEVQRAVLVALERLPLSVEQAGQVASGLSSPDPATTPADRASSSWESSDELTSRRVCLVLRLERRASPPAKASKK